jgi:hypothetical protein
MWAIRGLVDSSACVVQAIEKQQIFIHLAFMNTTRLGPRPGIRSVAIARQAA